MIYKYYASIIIEIWDLESRSKSPIFSNYGETVDGLSVIRAYGFAEEFSKKNMKLNDQANNVSLSARDLQIWYSFSLTVLGCLAFLIIGIWLLFFPIQQGKFFD
jgi:ABC-type multidrug transport system fused ATPase/permease subunit